MLSSSKEYLQALREGKYLLFLEWPQFIAEHYKDKGMSQDADEILNLLVFEWLNHGYCEEDAKKIAFLSAVHDLNTKPLQGKLSYALTAISIAVFQCMLYYGNNLQDHFLSKEKMNRQQVAKLMNGTIVDLDKITFESLLTKQQFSFSTWAKAVDVAKVEEAGRQISLVADLRYLTADYIADLEKITVTSDSLISSRLSMVNRLARYLNEQFELTTSVKEEVAVYVSKIRAMQPAEFEMGYLLSLSPPSLVDNTWRMVTALGLSFFNILQPTLPHAKAIVPGHIP